MKLITAGILLVISTFAMADVGVVNIWNPLPGKGSLTFEYGQEAQGIHEKMGANVIILADQMGRMHYVQTFSNWEAWAKFGEKVQASEEWNAFLSKTNNAPSAMLEDQYMINQSAPGEPGKVHQVFIWESEPGRGGETLQNALGAKKIHEKAGAAVSVSVDQMNRVHYVMSFDSWEAWGKFQDTPNPEFAEYMRKINANLPATLVKIYTASQI